MAVRRLSSRKIVHIIYDTEYEVNPESAAHLPDLRIPIQELGFDVEEHFIDPENMHERLAGIPRHDRNHIIFMHIDMPKKVSVGTPIQTVRYIEKHFKYVVGFRSEYCENTVWKSVMNDLFAKHHVPHVPSVRVATLEELDSERIQSKLQKLKLPYFIKVDDGYNSLGLSNNCVLYTQEDLYEKAKEMLTLYGAVMIQRFVSGREYTVAVNHQRAYHPVERIFEKGQMVSQPGGTASEQLLDPSDVVRVQKCQALAYVAYKAVKGSAYGRVDMREDPETGDIFVLEVNNTCSVAPKSYFEISVEACGSSKKKIVKDILKQVTDKPVYEAQH